MLKRKIDSYLTYWKNNRNTALLVKGVRQVGKTYSIREFINNNFNNVIEINFADRKDLIDLFVKVKNDEQLLIRLSAVAGSKMIPHETVFFFDEIQLLYERRKDLKRNNELDPAYNDLLTLIKKLVINNQYRFILSGSLLGVALNDISLNPTGYLDIYQMYPLDFEEFLWAKGVGEISINYLEKCFINKEEVDNETNKLFLDLFKEYVLIGGMPEAVDLYLNTKNLYNVQETHNQISTNYTADFSKYIDENEKKLRVREIFNAIPSELNSKNKRFMFSHVLAKNELNKCDLIDEFLWLSFAGIAIPVYNISEPVLPLTFSLDRKTLKVFLSDIGLLNSMALSTGVREKLLLNEKEINFGAPFENVVAQELNSHGFFEKLYYYNSKKHGEVDFIIEYNNEVLPIEIKSGKTNEMNIYNHSVLNNIIEMYHIKEAYVFGECNYKKETDVIHQFPIYMISFIKR